MTRAELKSAAKNQIKGNVFKLFLFFFIIFAINYAISAIIGTFTAGSYNYHLGFNDLNDLNSMAQFIGVSTGISAISSLLGFIITTPLTLGFNKVFLELIDNKAATFKTFFGGYEFAGKSIWLGFLVYFFTWLWTLLFIIPGIIKSISYSMAFYILADNPRLTAREALNESKRIMRGRKWEYFVLQLSFVWWILLGVVTFGLSFIYVGPYIQATTANFYNKIKNAE